MSEPRREAQEYITLGYTGHPFFDIGVAAITFFVGKRRPEEVREEDLVLVSTYIEQNYRRPPLRKSLMMAFTTNAWFAQDAFNPDKTGLPREEQEQRRAIQTEWARRHTQQWQRASFQTVEDGQQGQQTLERCVFTGQPVVTIPLSGKLAAGRAGRAQVPLLLKDEGINFFTNGLPGLPISGAALLALQFFPLACARCGIGLLAIHSDNESLLYRLAREIFVQNLADIVQAQTADEESLAAVRRVSAKTLLIDTLVKVERQRGNAEEDREPASITAYNFNNGKNLNLVLFHLPMEILEFLREAETARYKSMWDRIVQRGWRLAKARQGSKGQQSQNQKGGNQTTGGEEVGRSYNQLYEDLFDLPRSAARFIRTYFLHIPRGTDGTNAEKGPKLRGDRNWFLIELFLQKVVRMDTERLDQIRTLGDGFALYVRRQGGAGKRFFRPFFTERNPEYFRALLIKANIAHKRDGQPSLFDMETYHSVFEEGNEVMRPDWRLARDLVLMRMIDQLTDWLAQNRDAVPQEDQNGQDSGKEEKQATTA